MKYRANVGGGIVEAQKIKDYRFDERAQQHYLILWDGARRPQPVLHGMKPMIGDWYVETSTGTTRLRDGSQYEERSAAAIIKAVDFDITYSPFTGTIKSVEWDGQKLGETTSQVFVEGEESQKITGEQISDFVEVLGEELVASIEAVGKDVIDAAKPTPFEIEETVKEQLTEWANDVVAKDIAAQEASDNDIQEGEESIPASFLDYRSGARTLEEKAESEDGE